MDRGKENGVAGGGAGSGGGNREAAGRSIVPPASTSSRRKSSKLSLSNHRRRKRRESRNHHPQQGDGDGGKRRGDEGQTQGDETKGRAELEASCCVGGQEQQKRPKISVTGNAPGGTEEPSKGLASATTAASADEGSAGPTKAKASSQRHTAETKSNKSKGPNDESAKSKSATSQKENAPHGPREEKKAGKRTSSEDATMKASERKPGKRTSKLSKLSTRRKRKRRESNGSSKMETADASSDKHISATKGGNIEEGEQETRKLEGRFDACMDGTGEKRAMESSASAAVKSARMESSSIASASENLNAGTKRDQGPSPGKGVGNQGSCCELPGEVQPTGKNKAFQAGSGKASSRSVESNDPNPEEPSASGEKPENIGEEAQKLAGPAMSSTKVKKSEAGVGKENKPELANAACQEVKAKNATNKKQVTLTQGDFLADVEETLKAERTCTSNEKLEKIDDESPRPKQSTTVAITTTTSEAEKESKPTFATAVCQEAEAQNATKKKQVTLTQGDFLAEVEEPAVKTEKKCANLDGSMESVEIRARGKMVQYARGEVWLSADPKYDGFAFGLGTIRTVNMEHVAEIQQLYLRLENTYIGPEEANRVKKKWPDCEWVIVEQHELMPKDGRVRLKTLCTKLEAEATPRTTLYYKEEAPTYAYYNKGGAKFILPNGQERPVALDLFAGGGGMSIGLKKAGFNVKYKVDTNEACVMTLRKNFPSKKIYKKDIRDFRCELKGGRLKPKIEVEKITLVHGSPPCQGFSLVNTSGGDNDEQNRECTRDYLRIIEHIQPPFVSMENVPGMASKRKINDAEISNKQYLQEVMGTLLSHGYQVSSTMTFADMYGDPQRRKRLVLFGAKQRYQLPSNPRQTHGEGEGMEPTRTVQDVLGDLEDIEPNCSGRVELKTGEVVQGHFFVEERGGKKDDDDIRLYGEKPVAPTKGTANTLRKQNKMRHYKCNRYLTLLEYKRLMSFPDGHISTGGQKKSEMRDQIGNAVPVGFAHAIGKTIMESYRRGTCAPPS